MECDDILQLTVELIDEYRDDGYNTADLQPGDWVWLDDDGGELYLTADEIEIEIAQVEHAIASGDWGDDNWERRLDVLRDALTRLQAAMGGA